MMTEAASDPQAQMQSPLIANYLNQLAYALREADPADRDEVLATVHEHIATAIAEKPEPIAHEDITAILAGLGPVEQVAGDVEPSPRPGPAGWPGHMAVWPPLPRWPAWYGTALLIAGVLSLPLIIFQPPLALVMAVVTLTLGVAGSVVHEKPHKAAYRWAAALGALTLLIVFVALLGLLSVSGSSDTPVVDTVETTVAPPP